jgi:hypothetical protein
MILYGTHMRYRYSMNLSFSVQQIKYTKTLPLRLSLALYALFVIEADLIIKMTPPIVTTETLKNQNQKPIIQFKLYDPTTKQIRFTMPFNRNVTRLEEQKQVMVHEEVSIPKGTPLASQSYTGAINGINVAKDLMVDPSNRTKDVVHFMLPKPVVIQIAEQVNKNQSSSAGSMEFTLQPTDSAPISMTISGPHSQILITNNQNQNRDDNDPT